MGLKVLSDLVVGALTFPSSDGSAGQVLKTDGSGNLSFATVSTADTKLNALSFNTGSGVLTATLSSGTTVTVDLDGRYAAASHTHTYDNYQSWNLKTNGVQRTTVQSGGTLDLVAGSNVALSYGAGGVVTISSTDTNTDTNYYVDALSFNTSNGVLTVGRNGGLADLTVDLDGRYLTSVTAHTHAIGDIIDLEANLNKTITNASASNDTITFTRGDGTTFTVTTSDADTNNYADSVAFSTTTGVLTIGRNGSLADLTVDLDGRYLTGVPAEYLTQTEGDTLYQPIGNYQAAGTYNTIIGTDSDINTSGSTIIDNIYVTDGVITSMGTRTLTLGDLGYSGAADADNYGSWTISDSVNSEAIKSGDTLTVRGSGATTVTYDAGANLLIIDSTDTNTDTNTNYYLSGASFNTGDGVLTLTVTGATNQTVDLDGRYALSSHSHSYLPLSGGSLSGNLDLTGANPHIRWVPSGTNDAAGIRFNYSNNDGVMEFWTSDDYTEPFVWRSYDVGLEGTGTYQEWMKLVSNSLYVGGNKVATESYVSTAISNLVDSAPGTLDTLNELAAALGDDPNFATTVTDAIARKLDVSVNPIVSATVSNDTTTFVKADGTSFALTTSDANSNTYVTSASFNSADGVLTLTRNSGSVTVDLDGRYLQSLPAHTHPITEVDGLSDELNKVIYNASVSNDTITFTRGDGSTFTVTTSDANTNYYLNGITKSGNTLTFSVSGTTNQAYTFGSNAFTSYTDHSAAGYLAAADYTAADVLAKIKTVDGAGSGLDADTLDGLSNGSFFRSDAGNSVDVRFAAGNGRGVRFWDSDAYKIWMSSTGDATWGGRLDSSSDYNLYFKIGGGTNRGFVFRNDADPVAQIDSKGVIYTATTGDSTNWKDAYDNYITGISVSGTSTKTITLTQRDGGTISTTFTDIDTDTNTWRPVDDTPRDGQTGVSISSNWAFDNVKTAVPANAKFTDTTYSVGDGGLTEKNFTSALKTKLDGIAASANNYSHPGYTARSINTSGASVLDVFTSDTSGHVTNITTRTLTLGDLGYTGATNANYITKVSELTNDSGYLTSTNDRVYLTDSRGAVRLPSYYDDRYAQWDFQNQSDTGAEGDGWHGVLTVSKWSSFDPSHRQEQLIFTGDNLKRRTASSDSAWGDVKTIWDTGNLNPIVSATVSNDTTTYTKADGSTFALTTSDANTNKYLNGASFNTTNGVLTLTVASGTTITADLDGRYLESLPAHTHPIAEVDGLSAELSKVIYNATVSNDTITFTRGDGSTFTVTTSDADTDTWRPIHDTPVNGATTTSISSNWAFDNVKTAVPAGAVFTDTNTTYSAGTGLSLSGTTFSHADTSTLSGAYGGNNNGVVIEDITVDANGHITAIGTRDLDSRFAAASHSHSYDLYDFWTVADAAGTGQFNVGSKGNVKFRGAGATNVTFDPGSNTIVIDSTDTNTDTNTTYSAGSGLSLSGTTFSVQSDLRGEAWLIGPNTADYINVTGTYIDFVLDSAVDMRLYNSGTLHVEGDVIAYSTTISDKRLKDDVVTIDNALDKIKKLRGVEYVWNAGHRKGKKDLGLIAQEVEEVLPEIVHEHEMPIMKDGVEGEVYKTVDYEKMVGVLIEAMKEQQTQIDSLKAEVAALKGK